VKPRPSYSLDRNTLHVWMTDAMGHSVASALLATLAVGALRNTRRRGTGLSEQTQSAHEALLGYSGHSHAGAEHRTQRERH
jgi:hypothetical protein